MSRYELLALIVALVGAVTGVVSLVRTRKIAERQLAFQRITAELERRQLEILKAEELARNTAKVTAQLFQFGHNDFRFVVSNNGDVAAADVMLTIDDQDSPLIKSEVREKMPFPRLEPGDRFTLIAALTLSTPTQYRVRLAWKNLDGTETTREVHVSLFA